MSKKVLTDCYIEINGVDLSDHVDSVTVTRSTKDVDTSAFSGNGNTESTWGLSSDEFDVEFQQDFDASSVNAVLGPLVTNREEFDIEVRPSQAAVSSTNPKYTATCKLFEYNPLDGKVGDLSTTKVKFPAQRDPITESFS